MVLHRKKEFIFQLKRLKAVFQKELKDRLSENVKP